MIYLERCPHPALAPFIQNYWYARDPAAVHRHERVLPAGHAQLIINLARDYLTDANCLPDPLRHSPAALLLGLYTRHQRIDTFDIADLMGVVFQPGGTAAFFGSNAQLFTNCETSLEALWGPVARNLRDDLRQAFTPAHKFATLEAALLRRLQPGLAALAPVVAFALGRISRHPGTASMAALTRQIGLSSRRFSQVFREQIGVSPKRYGRILRFQRAVQQMHRGADIRWADLALDCGYYDQAHFANDFRAFSGLNPTTYIAAARRWSNHIPLDQVRQ